MKNLSAGKVVSIVIAVLVVAMIGFMISTDEPMSQASSAAPLQPKNTQKSNVVENSSNFQSNDELEKIKELKQSVSQTNENASKLYVKSCAPCHGQDGKGIIAPSIAGKSADEILTSLRNYKDGKIPNSLMAGLFTNVSDENLTALAHEISKF